VIADLLARCMCRICSTVSHDILVPGEEVESPSSSDTVSIFRPHRPHKLSNAKHGHVHHGSFAKKRILGAVFYVFIPLLGIFLL